MFERFRAALVPLLRLPGAPAALLREPASVRVFRVGRNFYRLRLAIWSVGQIATLVAIVISLGFLTQIKNQAEAIKSKRRAAAVVTEQASDPSSIAAPESSGLLEPDRAQRMFWDDPNNPLGRLIDREPWWLFPLITNARVRVTLVHRHGSQPADSLGRGQASGIDDELRERTAGVNIADIRVQSAGGGGQQSENDEEHAMHAGTFHSVDNAPEIRDLVLERLRKFRAAGLGDPDDVRDAAARESETAAVSIDTMAAARELLAVARDLRRARDV